MNGKKGIFSNMKFIKIALMAVLLCSFSFMIINSAYALTRKCKAGEYAYLSTQCKTCPENCYCPTGGDEGENKTGTGWTGISCNAETHQKKSNTGAVLDDGSFDIYLCPYDYPYADEGAKSITDCYLITEEGKYVGTAGAGQEECPNGQTCPGGVIINHGKIGGNKSNYFSKVNVSVKSNTVNVMPKILYACNYNSNNELQYSYLCQDPGCPSPNSSEYSSCFYSDGRLLSVSNTTNSVSKGFIYSKNNKYLVNTEGYLDIPSGTNGSDNRFEPETEQNLNYFRYANFQKIAGTLSATYIRYYVITLDDDGAKNGSEEMLIYQGIMFKKSPNDDFENFESSDKNAFFENEDNMLEATEIPIKDGYLFLGYSRGGTLVINSDGEPTEAFFEAMESINDDETWTAVFVPIYKITLSTQCAENEGCTGADVLYAVHGENKVYKEEQAGKKSVTSLKDMPSRDGYVFEGFYSSSTGGTEMISNSPCGGSTRAKGKNNSIDDGKICIQTALKSAASNATGDFTIYAHWTKCQTGVVINNECLVCDETNEYLDPEHNECVGCPPISGSSLYYFVKDKDIKSYGIESCAIKLKLKSETSLTGSVCGEGTNVVYVWNKSENAYVRRETDYSVMPGSRSLVKTTDLPSNTISEGANLANYDYCKACEGGYNINGKCVTHCNSGKCIDSTDECVPCPAGYDCSASGEHIYCPTSMICNNGNCINFAGNCVPCSSGEDCSRTYGQIYCSLKSTYCNNGKCVDDTGRCVSCPTGSNCEGTNGDLYCNSGMANRKRASACKENEFSSVGANGCSKCSTGTSTEDSGPADQGGDGLCLVKDSQSGSGRGCVSSRACKQITPYLCYDKCECGEAEFKEIIKNTTVARLQECGMRDLGLFECCVASSNNACGILTDSLKNSICNLFYGVIFMVRKKSVRCLCEKSFSFGDAVKSVKYYTDFVDVIESRQGADTQTGSGD